MRPFIFISLLSLALSANVFACTGDQLIAWAFAPKEELPDSSKTGGNPFPQDSSNIQTGHLGGLATVTEDETLQIEPVGKYELNGRNLVYAFRRGFFIYYDHRDPNDPRKANPNPVHRWENPKDRGILTITDFDTRRFGTNQIRRDMKAKVYSREGLRITYNQAFDEVVDRCVSMTGRKKRYVISPAVEAQPARPARGLGSLFGGYFATPAVEAKAVEYGYYTVDTTWLSPEIVKAYKEAHALGYAHSIEIWQDDKLVAGQFGMFADGVMSGESQFRANEDEDGSDVGRLVIEGVMEYARALGLNWIDIQTVTANTEKFGGRKVSREEHKMMMDASRQRWAFRLNPSSEAKGKPLVALPWYYQAPVVPKKPE